MVHYSAVRMFLTCVPFRGAGWEQKDLMSKQNVRHHAGRWHCRHGLCCASMLHIDPGRRPCCRPCSRRDQHLLSVLSTINLARTCHNQAEPKSQLPLMLIHAPRFTSKTPPWPVVWPWAQPPPST